MDRSDNPSASRLSRLPLPRSSRNPTQTNSVLLKPPQKLHKDSQTLFQYAQAAGVCDIPEALTESGIGGHAQDQKLPKSTVQTTMKRRLSLLPPKSSHGAVYKPTAASEHSLLDATTKHEPQPKPDAKSIRTARPSLSDRTVETLSQIPPSPSPRRRQSGVITNESPMRPPSRAASAMNLSRPTSRAGRMTTALRPTGRIETPVKYQNTPLSTTPSRRAISTYTPRNSTISSRNESDNLPRDLSTVHNQPSPSLMSSTPQTLNRKPLKGSKTMAYRRTAARAPLQSHFRNEQPETPVTQPVHQNGVKKAIQKIECIGEVTAGKPAGASALKSKARKPQGSTAELSDPGMSDARNISSSSQSLREVIAKAKAVRLKAQSGTQSTNMVPRSVENDFIAGTISGVDPHSLDLSKNVTINVLRQRINNAKADGKLNIAALGLTVIPPEVMNMYDSNDDGGIPWYETVDIIRLNAADNEISELNEAAFPPIHPTEHDGHGEIAMGGIFAGLKFIDIHGNQLKAIPSGFGNLPRLTSLNLSRNQITSDAIGVISQISSLRELRLAENALLGPLQDSICNLENLEILDLHENAVSKLPESIERLTKLKIVNVGGNKLTSIPFAALAQVVTLVEIVASRNRLEGTLLPPLLMNFPNLHTVNVSYNALESIADHEIEIPVLQSVDVSNNRILALPSSKTWPLLTSLNAGDNQIKLIPSDFSQLRNLKTVDLSSNSVTKIDDSIGFMDSLVQLRLSNNPMYERRLLNMTTGELKESLRDRLSSPISEKFAWTSGQAQSGSSLQSPALFSVKAGVLDRSRSRLREISAADFETVARDAKVKSFVLNHNLLQEIHPAIATFTNTLITLDLSHNKLGQNMAYMAQPLSLPVLQTLNLTSNALPSLDSLVEHLIAPKLNSLNLSFNRLVSFPLLCKAFPSLSTFLASNNVITELDVEAVRGLQTLDVSSNEIEYLPPRLALLQGHMRTLMVGGNKFRVPGWGILEKGTEDILNWCRRRIPAGEEGAIMDDGVS